MGGVALGVGVWSPSYRLTHLPRGAIPPIHLAHQKLGAVTGEASEATGLPKGLPVFGGAADHIASALAAGIVEPGDVLLKFGGAGDIIMAAEKARPDPRLFLDYHLVPGLFAPNGCMAASGSALNWLASLIGSDAGGGKPHPDLDKLAAEVSAGSDGVLCLPYFLGEKTPIQDPLARGTFTGLSLGHGPGHLWRALLEAVAYGFRHHVEVFSELGYAPKRFFASDGGSQSRVWMQIMADVLQQPVRLLGQPLWLVRRRSVGRRDRLRPKCRMERRAAAVGTRRDRRAVPIQRGGVRPRLRRIPTTLRDAEADVSRQGPWLRFPAVRERGDQCPRCGLTLRSRRKSVGDMPAILRKLLLKSIASRSRSPTPS